MFKYKIFANEIDLIQNIHLDTLLLSGEKYKNNQWKSYGTKPYNGDNLNLILMRIMIHY